MKTENTEKKTSTKTQKKIRKEENVKRGIETKT